MAINLHDEEIVTLRDAAGLLPRRRAGRKVAFSTLWRWATHGCRGHRLETLRVGATLCTSREALQRFCDRLSAGDTGEPVPARTDAARRKSHDRAMKELRAAGFIEGDR